MDFAVVYDTFFGNTAAVAEAIAEEVAWFGSAELLAACDVQQLEEIDAGTLLIGCPTQRHGMTNCLAELLGRSTDLSGRRFAAFDTRYRVARWRSGSAAKRISRALRRLGAVELQPPESFFVESREGPLEPGELNLARDWALRAGERAMLTPAP